MCLVSIWEPCIANNCWANNFWLSEIERHFFSTLQSFNNSISVNNFSKQLRFIHYQGMYAFSFKASTPNKKPLNICSILKGVWLQCGAKNCELLIIILHHHWSTFPTNEFLQMLKAFVMWIQHNCKHVVCLDYKKCFTKFKEWSNNFDNWAWHTRIQNVNFKVEIIALEWWIWYHTMLFFYLQLEWNWHCND